ncbi:DJ-1/PfpI family protein [Candidatus Woesearchaeota archaeon]|nr:DJ-1/PfpI family protein [Candidatus Woesearchaeota archaeon]
MKAVFIIAPIGFRDEELLEPLKILKENNIEVSIASKNTTEAIGKLGAKIKVDIDVTKINVNNYDAIIFIGGPGTKKYLNDTTVQNIARQTVKNNKILAAICMAPSILANANLLQNKKATAFEAEKDNLIQKGAIWQDKPVVIENKLITANGPSSAKGFGKVILELLNNQI